MKLGIGVCGAAGRVGRTIVEVCKNNPDYLIASAFGRSSVGVDAGLLAGVGNLGVDIIDSVSFVGRSRGRMHRLYPTQCHHHRVR